MGSMLESVYSKPCRCVPDWKHNLVIPGCWDHSSQARGGASSPTPMETHLISTDFCDVISSSVPILQMKEVGLGGAIYLPNFLKLMSLHQILAQGVMNHFTTIFVSLN